jgi:hypothetical protein
MTDEEFEDYLGGVPPGVLTTVQATLHKGNAPDYRMDVANPLVNPFDTATWYSRESRQTTSSHVLGRNTASGLYPPVTGWGNVATYYYLRIRATDDVTYTQKYVSPTFVGTYLPSAMPGHRGWAFVVARERRTSPANVRTGLYLYNLTTQARIELVTPILEETTQPTTDARVLGATERHVLWELRTTAGKEVRLTHLVTGETRIVTTPASAAAFVTKPLYMVRPDFVYHLDDDDEDKGNRFVDAWDFPTGTPTLLYPGTNFPPLDEAMGPELGALLPLPVGVTPYASDAQVINSPQVLEPIDRYLDLGGEPL